MYLLLAFLCPLHGVDEALSKAGDKNFLYRLGWQYPQLNMGRIVELLRLKCQCNEIRVVANERLLNCGKEIGLRTGNDEASCDMAPQRDGCRCRTFFPFPQGSGKEVDAGLKFLDCYQATGHDSVTTQGLR